MIGVENDLPLPVATWLYIYYVRPTICLCCLARRSLRDGNAISIKRIQASVARRLLTSSRLVYTKGNAPGTAWMASAQIAARDFQSKTVSPTSTQAGEELFVVLRGQTGNQKFNRYLLNCVYREHRWALQVAPPVHRDKKMWKLVEDVRASRCFLRPTNSLPLHNWQVCNEVLLFSDHLRNVAQKK